MKHIGTLIILIFVLAIASPALATIQKITIINQAHIQFRDVNRLERALIIQSQQLQKVWNTPVVQFDASGWRLYLRHGSIMYGPGGIHGYNRTPFAIVWTEDNSLSGWSWAASHELVEMLIDPDLDLFDAVGQIDEVCDPLQNTSHPEYKINNIWVSSFVGPDYFILPFQILSL